MKMIVLAVASNQQRQKQGLCWEKESWIPDKWATLQYYVLYHFISLWLERLMPVYHCKHNYHWAFIDRVKRQEQSKLSVCVSFDPNSSLLEHRHHPDESGSPRWGQTHFPDLCWYPRWEFEGPSRPQELSHKLPVQPGQAAPRTGTPGGNDRLQISYAKNIFKAIITL